MSNPEITFANDNMLVVDGQMLQTRLYTADRRKLKVSPDDLQTLLSIGNRAIKLQMETIHETVRARNLGATIELPSIWTVQMTGPRHTDEYAYTDFGLNNNTGITRDPLELKEPFREYWHAIERAGFVAEARKSVGKSDAGAWLLTRIDPTPR